MWQEHTPNTWIVEDNARRIIAIIRYHRRLKVYEARKNHKKLGFYSTLEAAQCAVQPKTKPTKTPQDTPWDS
jgi:hypothetical protein